MVIGDQMVFRRPVLGPSVVTLQAVTVVLWEVNIICNIHCRVQPCLPMITYSCWTTSAIWTGSHCRPIGGWMDVSTDCCTMYQWCVSSFSSDLWNIHTPIDYVLDGRVVQTHSKIDSFCEQRWLPGKKSTYFAPALSPRTIGNNLLAAGFKSHVPLATLPLTPRHHQAQLLWCHERADWRVEWHSVVWE